MMYSWSLCRIIVSRVLCVCDMQFHEWMCSDGHGVCSEDDSTEQDSK